MKKLDVHIEMDNGDVFDVQTKTSDYMLYEETAKRHKWGGLADNPAKWEAFLAWSALRRLGKYGGTWETFKGEVDIVEATQIDVDPTPTAVGDASLSS